MKTTTQMLVGGVVVAWCLSAGVAAAGQLPGATEVLIATAGTAQSKPSASEEKEKHRRSADYLSRARQAMAENDLETADVLISKAETVGAQYSVFHMGDTPKRARKDLQRKRETARKSPTLPSRIFANNLFKKKDSPKVDPFAGRKTDSKVKNIAPFNRTASHAVYDPASDPTRNIPAGGEQLIRLPGPRQLDFAQRNPQPTRIPTPPAAPVASGSNPLPADGTREPIATGPAPNAALSLFLQGEAALKNHDTDQAYLLFQRASEQQGQLDPITARRLQDYLQLLSVPSGKEQQTRPVRSVADEAAVKQRALTAQLLADVAHTEAKARAELGNNPNAAVTMLEEIRTKIEAAGLEPVARGRLLARTDRALGDMRRYIEQHRPLIELEEKNVRIKEEIQREQHLKLENQDKLALMVDNFNKLMDEQRYAEAEVIAKRAGELDPTNPVIRQLLWQSKFVRSFMNNQAVRAEKENGFLLALGAVDKSSIPFNDLDPYQLPDAKIWGEITMDRKKWLEQSRHRSKREIEIEQKLKTPVMLEFHNEPLSNVLDHLARLAAVNLFLDPQGLAEEGVASNTPVTIEVRHEIMLKSALNLILEPLHLSYVIKDEVLKVTSEQLRDGEVYTISYSVADLVIPIPNFVPSTRMGLAGAYHDALGNVGFGGAGPWGAASGPMAVMANNDGSMNSGVINPGLLAQMARPTGGGATKNMPLGFGPGGLGGGSQADFDSLIELITSTIQPTTWDEVGGAGSIAPFETNLSRVVSQTQDVHEEIVDLLEQLRRLQDLQVTIEVRFITLNDDFFERIGVDFDFDISDNIDPAEINVQRDDKGNVINVDSERSVTVGMSAPGIFSADLDIPFTQGSYDLAVPQFGGFDPTTAAGAQLGFAILSDIEAFFFINAAQGDKRSNVLQAPKVTLFNGQQAFVSDTSQSPFVISVIPVVGDFAAAQQPVIVVLTEGTFMTVQAVVSHDKRFVRLTVVPFFSKIEEVNTFQFEGTKTTTTDTAADNEGWINLGDDDNPDWHRNNDSASNNNVITSQGTTVQLPTFSFVTVTTTVSVPDGGTVLLGGIKRLSEGRNEYGVPMLNKIPYINRLFKNVGIGRETKSLMMMVTPRIIIQEEEEEKLGILPP